MKRETEWEVRGGGSKSNLDGDPHSAVPAILVVLLLNAQSIFGKIYEQC
jgi:hypothetical protein